jgi:hypothetical protein
MVVAQCPLQKRITCPFAGLTHFVARAHFGAVTSYSRAAVVRSRWLHHHLYLVLTPSGVCVRNVGGHNVNRLPDEALNLEDGGNYWNVDGKRNNQLRSSRDSFVGANRNRARIELRQTDHAVWYYRMVETLRVAMAIENGLQECRRGTW